VIASGKSESLSQSSSRGFAFQLQNIRNLRMVDEETNNGLKLYADVTKYTIRTGISLAATMLAALLFKLAKKYKTTLKVRAQNSDKFYAIIWSVAIVSLLVNWASISIIITLVLIPVHSAKEGVNIAYLIAVLLIEFILSIFVKKDKDFRVPILLTCCCNNTQWNKIVQILALWNAFISMQLLLFHGVFIFIVFINHPLGSFCMVMVYALTLYCLVTSIATIMLGGMVLEKLIRRQEIGSMAKCTIDMLAAFVIGVVVLCLFVLAAGFTFVDGTINPFRVTAIANPIIASMTLGAMGWVARKMVIRYWLESENDETFVIIS